MAREHLQRLLATLVTLLDVSNLYTSSTFQCVCVCVCVCVCCVCVCVRARLGAAYLLASEGHVVERFIEVWAC